MIYTKPHYAKIKSLKLNISGSDIMLTATPITLVKANKMSPTRVRHAGRERHDNIVLLSANILQEIHIGRNHPNKLFNIFIINIK